jgi:hypothetical protein
VRPGKQEVKELEKEDIYQEIKPLGCLDSMLDYYQLIFKSIYHLVGHKTFSNKSYLAHVSFDEVRALRRYVNADLNNLSIEFYLQRVGMADYCRVEIKKGAKEHWMEALKDPAHHPCAMRGGFKNIVEGEDYGYEEFLGETLPMFVAIHSHLVSINRALGNLYYYTTEAPFSSFTPTGKSEIRNLTRQLNRIMKGLLIATHLQPQSPAQYDLINYLISCRADCQHFFETIPRYYQTHRMRLVVFPIDLPVSGPNRMNDLLGFESEVFPVTCVPWSAGVYLDFLTAYEDIALHVMAVLIWTIRLYSLWYFVPRRYLRLIAPMGAIYGQL